MPKFAFPLFQHIHPRNLLRNLNRPQFFHHLPNYCQVLIPFLYGFYNQPSHYFPFLLATLAKASFFLEYISLDQFQY
jgi:hypothetical protein